jgi:hypothetical protein
MPTYTVTQIVYKANGDKEFYNVDTLQTTCQTITAESVSGTTHTLTTNTGEIIYDAMSLQCVIVEPSGSNPGGLQCFEDGNPVDSEYWLNNNAGPGGGVAWGDITGTLSAQTDLQSALDGKEPDITAGTIGQYFRGDKSWQTLDKAAVGLANVDNTSDANKPVSTATQTALNAKQDTLVSGTNIKTINGTSVLGSGDIVTPDTNTNIANTDLTSTGDRTHNFATNFLKFTNATEYRWDKDVTGWTGGQSFMRMYKSGNINAWNVRVGDPTNSAAIQVNCDETGATSQQLELSAKGNTVIDIDSDTHVRFGTTLSANSAKIRIMGNMNAHYIELKVPDLIGADVSYTLPQTIVADGIAQTDASGVISWINAVSLTNLVNTFTDALKGAVPASGGGTDNFLRADGTWAPPGGGGSAPLFIPLSANFASTSTTRAAVTGWTFACGAGKTYRIEIIADYQSVATTTGGSMGFVLTSGSGTIRGFMEADISQSTVATMLRAPIRAISNSNTLAGSFMTSSGVSVINSPHSWYALVTLTCTVTGVFVVQWGTEVAASSAQLNANSSMIVTTLN